MSFSRFLSMALMMCLLPLGSQAHERPFHHIHPKKEVVVKKKKKKVKVVYEEEPEVVYVKKKRKRSNLDSAFSIRGVGVSNWGNKLGLSEYENGALGGIGFAMRGMVDRYWGVEFAVDFLGGGQLDFYQSQVPLQLSFAHYFVPHSVVRPFIIAGGGLQFTSLDYANGLYGFDMTEVTNHLGGGALVKLGSRLAVSTEMRMVSTWATLSNTLELSESCAAAGVCPNETLVTNGDRLNLGAQFTVSFSYLF